MAAPLAIGFLGAGQMATALAKGWAAAGLLDAEKSLASDPYPAAREAFAGGPIHLAFSLPFPTSVGSSWPLPPPPLPPPAGGPA